MTVQTHGAHADATPLCVITFKHPLRAWEIYTCGYFIVLRMICLSLVTLLIFLLNLLAIHSFAKLYIAYFKFIKHKAVFADFENRVKQWGSHLRFGVKVLIT